MTKFYNFNGKCKGEKGIQCDSRGDDLRLRRLDMRELAPAQLLRNVRLQDRVKAGRAAADVSLRGLAHLEADLR